VDHTTIRANKELDPQLLQGMGGAHHILTARQTAEFTRPRGQGGEQQGPVRQGLVTGYSDGASEPSRLDKTLNQLCRGSLHGKKVSVGVA
jgi:hypothetical protein